MLYALLSVFFLAMIAPFIYRQSSVKVPVFLAVCTAGIVGYFLSYMPDVAKGLTHTFQYPWADSLGVSLSFYVDGLSLFFALLISFFGLVIILYAGYYMKGMEHANRFLVTSSCSWAPCWALCFPAMSSACSYSGSLPASAPIF
jgi:multicomponent Na+:H+ antiporter subunit A